MDASRVVAVYNCPLLAISPASVFGIDDAELGALSDVNTGRPLADMSANRHGDLEALTSPRFTEALEAQNIQPITYRDLIAREGLKVMRRPAG
jgi:hypothetical protein